MTSPSPQQIFSTLSARKGLLLAVSGGPDSTALMILAARWKHEARPRCAIRVATVNHGLRREADRETRLVASNAGSLGLDCMILKASIDDGESTGAGNVQARARLARYRCLADAAAKLNLDTIVTGHHRDDQAETFLLRLARGSGVYGLGAMRAISWPFGAVHGEIVLARPLLGLGRSDLLRIVEDSGLDPVHDPSNQNMAFARVRMRSIAPVLAEAGLTAGRLSKTAERMQVAADALDYYSAEHLRTTVGIDEFGSARVAVPAFLDAPTETALRSLGRLLQAVGGSDYTPRLDRLEAMLSVLRDRVGKSGQMRRTLNGCVADLKNGHLRLYREWGRCGLEQIAAEPGTGHVWDRRFLLTIADEFPGKCRIAALGEAARYFRGLDRLTVLQTIPALYRGSELVALPDFVETRRPADYGWFRCRNLVAERLFNLPVSLPDEYEENSC